MNVSINIIGKGCTCDLATELQTVISVLESPTVQNSIDKRPFTIKGAGTLTLIKFIDENSDNKAQD